MSAAQRVVVVFGLSGVGKSWLCSRYASQTGALHVTASALLRRAKEAASGEPVDSEALRTGAVLDNQQVLVKEFEKYRSSNTQSIIFDGHNVVDSEAELTFIPHEVVRDLKPNGIIFVLGDPELIRSRREQDTTRVRPFRTDEVLKSHQDTAVEAAKNCAVEILTPFLIVNTGDEAGFAEAANSMIKEK